MGAACSACARHYGTQAYCSARSNGTRVELIQFAEDAFKDAPSVVVENGSLSAAMPCTTQCSVSCLAIRVLDRERPIPTHFSHSGPIRLVLKAAARW